MTAIPTTFISYSWDNDDHKAWVRRLVERLRGDGANVQFDQTDVKLGDRLPHFMERIGPSDYVLFICTPNYKLKADGRKGGVGYEGHIITAETMKTRNERKFIPVLAAGTWDDSLPIWAGGKFGADLSEIELFEKGYQDILETIGEGRLRLAATAPTVQSTKTAHNAVPETVTDAGNISVALTSAVVCPPIKIIGIILDQVTEPKMDGSHGSALYQVPFRLSGSPTDTWTEIFLNEWQFPKMFTTMHRPGTARIYDDRLVLDGVTMEEVRDVHKQTLDLCISEANQKEAEYQRKRAAMQAANESRSIGHRQRVQNIAKQIKFD